MPTALAALLCPQRDVGLYPDSSCRPLSPPASLTSGAWPSSLLHPTLTRAQAHPCSCSFMQSVSLPPGLTRPQEVHLGHAWHLDLTHSVEDLRGPQVSSRVSLRVLPGRWLSKHCVFQKQMASRYSLCGWAPSWNFWCVLQLGWAADLASSPPQQDCCKAQQ